MYTITSVAATSTTMATLAQGWDISLEKVQSIEKGLKQGRPFLLHIHVFNKITTNTLLLTYTHLAACQGSDHDQHL